MITMIHRTIVIFIIVVISLTAQVGLPQYGVALGGSVDAPEIVNNSGHRIWAYTLTFDNGNGDIRPWLYDMTGQLRSSSPSAVGIPSGTTYTHKSSVEMVDSAGRRVSQMRGRVSLDSVLFDDGRLVGPDKSGSLDQISARMQAEKDVHDVLLKAPNTGKAWESITALSNGSAAIPNSLSGKSALYQNRYQKSLRIYAAELLGVRQKGGDSAANVLAKMSSNYPTIRKGE